MTKFLLIVSTFAVVLLAMAVGPSLPQTPKASKKTAVAYASGGLPPQIISSATDNLVYQGSNITFFPLIISTNQLFSQWFKSNVKIVNATNLALTLTNLSKSDAGVYQLRTTNLYGAAEIRYSLTVLTTNILTNCVSGIVNLAWCPSPSTNVVGYTVYWGIGNPVPPWMPAIYDTNNPCSPPIYPGTNFLRSYSMNTNVGGFTNVTLQGLTNGVTYYMSVTARDSVGLESDFSNEIRHTQEPPKLKKVTMEIGMLLNQTPRIQTKVCPYQVLGLQYTTNFTSWSAITNLTADPYGNVIYDDLDPSKGPYRFYRMQIF